MFVTYYPGADKMSRAANALLEDRDGSIWCGTLKGLYKLELKNERWAIRLIDLANVRVSGEDALIETIVQDAQGSLWIGTDFGLYRRFPDGAVEEYKLSGKTPATFVNTLFIDSKKNVWVGTRFNGLYKLTNYATANDATSVKPLTAQDGLGSNWIASIFECSDGTLWVGTNAGLSKAVQTKRSDGLRFESYTTAQGLSDAEVWAIGEDESGSLWLGTANGGAMKFVRDGFTTYDERDGLGESHIVSIFEDRSGQLCVVGALSRGKSINRFDGARFTSSWPKAVKIGGWGWGQVSFQDREGDWWLDSGSGVYRIAPVSRFEKFSDAHIKAHYTIRDGLGTNEIFRLFEDSHGDVWISGMGEGSASITRWERATQTLHRYGPAEGVRDAPTAFREDAAGNLWIGSYGGTLARYTGGRFQYFSESDGKPAGMVRALYLDAKHRLWIASSRGGVSRVDNPADEHPRFLSYTTRDGLSSNDIWAITEDGWRRMYFGTGRALDQFDAETGHVRHYTSADGLARGKVEEAFRDHEGNLWFGTPEGLSRFVPQPEKSQAPPAVRITGLRIAGATQMISALGETSLGSFELEAQQKDLQIDFVGLDFAPGEVVRYQYKLEGADKDWSAPTFQHGVSYANLAAGKYRFLVRAVNAGGVTSATPATITFSILPPIWQRWWFLFLATIAIVLLAQRVHKYRLAQALKLERVRMRIATDLHDDIGSSLSQVSVLSEVISRRVRGDPAVAEPLATIGSVARDLVDSLNDIVWAINPRRDHLSDLTQRMRRFASDVFTARDIDFMFRAPRTEQDLKLGADMRRDIFLIFKESVNNIVRHSHCSRADISFEVVDGMLKLRVADNGKGMNGQVNGEGNGLFSMQQRAANLGGAVDVISNNGSGTTVSLSVPLSAPRWHWRGLHSNGNSQN
jgi:signal transduction histidine kinase/ligand-binding sensor domain-containing protein